MDKFKRKDWVKILKAISSKDCERESGGNFPYHFHSKFEFGRVRKVEHAANGHALYYVTFGDGCEAQSIVESDLASANSVGKIKLD